MGIPLARLDKLSVVMTYARGLFGGMAIIGFIFTFMAFMMWVTGEHLDELAQTMVACAGVCFALGVFAGLCTYLFPLQTTRRERAIRRSCRAILGIAVDPARMRPDFARTVDGMLQQSPAPTGPAALVHELVRTRARIALGEPALALEDHTDDLLERIRIQETVAG